MKLIPKQTYPEFVRPFRWPHIRSFDKFAFHPHSNSYSRGDKIPVNLNLFQIQIISTSLYSDFRKSGCHFPYFCASEELARTGHSTAFSRADFQKSIQQSTHHGHTIQYRTRWKFLDASLNGHVMRTASATMEESSSMNIALQLRLKSPHYCIIIGAIYNCNLNTEFLSISRTIYRPAAGLFPVCYFPAMSHYTQQHVLAIPSSLPTQFLCFHKLLQRQQNSVTK